MTAQEKTPTRFYQFKQNNSGGGFRSPAINVIIEATSVDEANVLALDHGLYFDGVADERDCPCCGDRWYPVRDEKYDVSDVPSIYNEPIDITNKSVAEETGGIGDFSKMMAKADKVPYVKVFFKDGSTYQA